MPISALKGDNVVTNSERMAWHEGPPLMHLLETVYIGSDRNMEDFRFPVQYVTRPNLDFRGFAGTLHQELFARVMKLLPCPLARRVAFSRS